MICAGNSTEFCGGPSRLNLYNYTGTDLPPNTGGGNNGGGNTGAPVFPVLDGLQTGWAYNACWVYVHFFHRNPFLLTVIFIYLVIMRMVVFFKP
jgi:hypothetical protein